MPTPYRRIVGQVLSISREGGSLLVEVEYTTPRFLGRPKIEARVFRAHGSVARALPHWIYVGGTFDFQVDESLTEIIGISEVR